MTKKEMDEQRASVLYEDEVLKVRCIIGSGNFKEGKIYDAKPRFARRSGLSYPNPKWIACDYRVEDEDGDVSIVSKNRYGEIKGNFEWIRR